MWFFFFILSEILQIIDELIYNFNSSSGFKKTHGNDSPYVPQHSEALQNKNIYFLNSNQFLS